VKSVNLDTNGSASQSYTADDLGTEMYPGAEGTKGGMKMNLAGVSMVTGAYLTSDTKEQVIAFYQDKMGSDASVTDTGSGAVITQQKDEKESVMVTISARPSQDDGKTKIVIVHTKKSN
jgi:hypothetical protein